ncbi:MAG: hypothetical protein HXS41_15660 [Theionarchaea archaeon]|nr:hypothetical protein [Theionarchaea archaeon]
MYVGTSLPFHQCTARKGQHLPRAQMAQKRLEYLSTNTVIFKQFFMCGDSAHCITFHELSSSGEDLGEELGTIMKGGSDPAPRGNPRGSFSLESEGAVALTEDMKATAQGIQSLVSKGRLQFWAHGIGLIHEG